jgi:hypothetical protein
MSTLDRGEGLKKRSKDLKNHHGKQTTIAKKNKPQTKNHHTKKLAPTSVWDINKY